MHIVRLTLTSPDRRLPTDADAHVLKDVLWAHADPFGGLEHVQSRVRQDSIDLVIFTSGGRADSAPAHSLAMCSAALSRSPAFQSWRVSVVG
ncbi:hypothetical protein [Streptomyces sp. NRRL S-350]|uniref:hypothetical protein n=1 Tax=Streptomyces sp. NRRL S-350 TaxID=1463902 RepID=UPI0004BF0357|nr:hypothetical protein [Streptomyces sp. NRRL S-350]